MNFKLPAPDQYTNRERETKATDEGLKLPYPALIGGLAAKFNWDVEDRLRVMGTYLRKTGESSYEVLIGEKAIGQVWNWHGSWSAQAGNKTYHGHKSRKQAVERVVQIHERSD